MDVEITLTSCKQKTFRTAIRHRLILGIYNDACCTPQIVIKWKKYVKDAVI
jgi:hypothetical protein